MYVKFLIVSVLPITLARHVLYGVQGFWPHINPGRQFHFRNPDSENFGVNPGTQFSVYNTNFGDFRPYQDGNYDAHEQYERYVDQTNRHGYVQPTNQDVRNNEQPDFINSEYQIQHGNKKKTQHNDNRDETYYTNDPVNSDQPGFQRHHEANSKLSNNGERSRTIEHTQNNKQGKLKTNIHSQTPIYNENPSNGRTNYHLEDVTSAYDPKEYVVRVNEDAESVNRAPIDQSSVVEPSVPEINLAPRLADPQVARDNLPRVSTNGDSMIFADNPQPVSSVKTTTDNEVKVNKNEGSSRNEDGKWVWTETVPTTTVVPPKKPAAGGDLDDRVSFAGDGCPKGEAKVLGQCVKKHKKE